MGHIQEAKAYSKGIYRKMKKNAGVGGEGAEDAAEAKDEFVQNFNKVYRALNEQNDMEELEEADQIQKGGAVKSKGFSGYGASTAMAAKPKYGDNLVYECKKASKGMKCKKK